MSSSICTALKKAFDAYAPLSGIAGEATNTFELVMKRAAYLARQWALRSANDPELSWQKQFVGEG